MTLHPSIQENYSALLTILKQRDAVVIAGTGVTAATTPNNSLIRSWPALLANGVQFCLQYCQQENDLSEHCRLFSHASNADMDTLLNIGDEIQQYLNQHGLMTNWLNSVFGGLSKEEERLIRAIQQLGIPIATTNYDHLFEDITRQDAISWKDTPKLHAFLRGNTRTILHLHGHYRDAASIILGRKSYRDLLDDEFVQFAEQSLFARNNVVFIGFGDSTKDPNFSRLLTWAKRYLSATNIYRVVRGGELAKLQAEHDQLGYNIRLVSYGETHAELPAFVEGLASQLPVQPPNPPNLPGCPDCVGRGSLIEEVVTNLVDLSAKPACLLGTGGIGKTNLILNALYHRKTAARFGERRYFVRCEAAHNAETLWNTVLTALTVPRNPQLSSQQQLEYVVAQQPTLLVLDNFETPYQAEPKALEDALLRLRKIDSLKLVVTNRGREKPGLKMGWQPFRVHHLDEQQAKELFVDLTDDSYATDLVLPTLLKAVDYLPLAITLLAKRTEDYPTLAGLYRQWQTKKTELLTLAPDDKDLSLEASILLSLNSPRLSDTAREVFKALCHLPAGLNRDDLTSTLPNDEEAINRLLKTLLAEEDATGRVRVLAPVREFILKKFPADPDYRSRLLEAVLVIAAENGPKIGKEELAFQRIEAEWNNLLAIFEQHEYDKKRIETLDGLTLFCQFSGLSLVHFLKEAVQVAKANDWPALQANCLRSLGNLAFRESENQQARTYFEQALPLYENVEDLLGKANCLRSLGDLAFRELENQQARTYFEQALPLYENVEALLGKANCLRSLGDLAFRESENQQARTYFEQALPLYEKLGDLLGKANCLKSLGDLAFRELENQQARTYFEQALPLYEKLGVLLGKANCLTSLGDLAFREGNNTLGNRHYQEAIQHYQRINDRYSIARAYLLWSRQEPDETQRNQYRCEAKKALQRVQLYKLIDEWGLSDAC